jgi:hypothetical protein
MSRILFFACQVTLMNGKKTVRPYKSSSSNGAKALANLREDVLECHQAIRLSEEQYKKLVELVPPSKRDTSKRCPS